MGDYKSESVFRWQQLGDGNATDMATSVIPPPNEARVQPRTALERVPQPQRSGRPQSRNVPPQRGRRPSMRTLSHHNLNRKGPNVRTPNNYRSNWRGPYK